MTPLLGIYGGTFDPVHRGHLAMAVYARWRLQLSRVHLVVAAVPPHRPQPVLPAAERLRLLQRAVRDVPGLLADDCELRRLGPSYTVATLEWFRRRHPRHRLVLLLGADACAGLSRWHRAERLAALCHLAVLRRPGSRCLPRQVPGFTPVPPGQANRLFRRRQAGCAVWLNNPLHSVSATEIRRRWQQGLALADRLPSGVEPAYCRAMNTIDSSPR